MAAPTTRPRVLIKVEADGVHRLMILSPFTGNEAVADPFLIDTLRVYYAPHRASSGGLTFLTDLSLSIATGIIELTFEPGVMGLFAFSFVNAADEEGPQSTVAKYVYARTSVVRTVLTARCLGSLTDTELMDLVGDATDIIETFTRQRFYPFYISKVIDGWGAYSLPLDSPIVQVTEVQIRAGEEYRIVEPSRFKVYNRHIAARNAYSDAEPTRVDGWVNAPGDGTGGMLEPDDRRNPQISFDVANDHHKGQRNTQFRGFRSFGGASLWNSYYGIPHQEGYPRGRQNVVVKGFFGFTEPDLATPTGIVIATELLARRDALIRYGDQAAAYDAANAHRKIMEHTDTHTVQYQRDERVGTFTGDPIIDTYIAYYTRPMGVGAI